MTVQSHCNRPERLVRGLQMLALVLTTLGFSVFGTGCASIKKPDAPAAPAPTSAAVGQTTIVAIQPSAPSGGGTSLAKFLGLPEFASGVCGVAQRIGSRVVNSLDLTGRFPALQPQPPLVPLTDPANMAPDAPPAVQAAAEIKAEEDAAPQKIMAIRYLATLGCGGCYDKVEQALLEALSDCTEEVRFEAVKALQCKPECRCVYCASPSCCSPAIRKKLEELTTCEKEPSARIRRAARLALECCRTKPLETDDVPREGPTAAPPVAGEPGPAVLDPSPIASIFDEVALVSYQSIAIPVSPTDNVLAMVNGEPIYQSQVEQLIARKAQANSGSQTSTTRATITQAAIAEELARLVDWKLLEQTARRETAAAGIAVTGALSPAEVKLWFERKCGIDAFVSPQELLAYYELHKDRYRLPDRVRWESFSVSKDNFKSVDEAAMVATYVKRRAAGEQVPAPAEFDPTAVSLETHDWTDIQNIPAARTRNLVSNMKPGEISSIIDEGDSLRVIRLMQREAGRVIPPNIVSAELATEILSARRRAAEERNLVFARVQASIWTAPGLATATKDVSDQNSRLSHGASSAQAHPTSIMQVPESAAPRTNSALSSFNEAAQREVLRQATFNATPSPAGGRP